MCLWGGHMGRYQSGQIYEASGAFFVRYYVSEIVDGKPTRVQRSYRLCERDKFGYHCDGGVLDAVGGLTHREPSACARQQLGCRTVCLTVIGQFAQAIVASSISLYSVASSR